MVRMSDILKQRGNFPEPSKPKKDKEEKPASTPKEPTENMEEKATQGIPFTKAIAENKPKSEKETHMVKTMRQMQLNPEELQRIYNQALEVIRDIFNKPKSQDTPLDLTQAYKVVEEIVDRIVIRDKEIISLTTFCSEDNYIYSHSINVCILSVYVGLGMGYNKSKLNELGLGALLHDLGMMNVLDISQQQRTLSEAEFTEIKKHPNYTSELLNRIKNVEEGIIYVVQQTHERINGTGYPAGITEDQIHEFAKIVAVADVYEALTHPRPYRKAMSPHDGVKELLNMSYSGLLDGGKIIKILINEIGIYPVGDWVELSTGEIGKVVLGNPDWPLRPRVNVIFGADREMLEEIKPIDLSYTLNIFIKKSVDPKTLNLKLGLA